MREFEKKNYKVFDLFNNSWGLVTAGNKDSYNTCTIGWGSLGTIWGNANNGKQIVTVYVNPKRYTWQFLKKQDKFTISFFPDEAKYKKALVYLGRHSGRDEDKIKNANLTPIIVDDEITFKEANLVFICKKLYQDAFKIENMSDEIKERYQNFEPHWFFIGEIIDCIDKR